ncbi:hypothetical protein [Saccharopolyspora sp. 5N708]|uniref:hypothetical protein n=1 Tax=Saccharopolyspora sp. 5N708 TaxID=3457424 RepID=UPI003FD4A9FE
MIPDPRYPPLNSFRAPLRAGELPISREIAVSRGEGTAISREIARMPYRSLKTCYHPRLVLPVGALSVVVSPVVWSVGVLGAFRAVVPVGSVCVEVRCWGVGVVLGLLVYGVGCC